MAIHNRTVNPGKFDWVDFAIEEFSKLENPSQNDLNKVIVAADVQYKIDTYRAQAKGMTIEELENEKHQSERLAEFLGKRPHSKCHAHAIVSGGHPRAAAARAILAWFEMRIDDPENGCWLPENTAALREMPSWLKRAIPHSRIHRNGYYFWLNTEVNLTSIKESKDLLFRLKQVAARLQNFAFPSYVMIKAEELKQKGIA
ncbi:MAG: AHH domain-containing protein [Gammaproteobacteria bacterium]|nr:AHH domain-containing protein [Gammaproteobacteria bacterium]